MRNLLIIIFMGLAFTAAVFIAVRMYFQTEPLARHGELEFRPAVVFNKAMPPITDIPVKSVDQVAEDDGELPPNTLVLGVTVNGQSRAYPLNQLVGPSREIFNDELGGRAIMPTW